MYIFELFFSHCHKATGFCLPSCIVSSFSPYSKLFSVTLLRSSCRPFDESYHNTLIRFQQSFVLSIPTSITLPICLFLFLLYDQTSLFLYFSFFFLFACNGFTLIFRNSFISIAFIGPSCFCCSSHVSQPYISDGISITRC